MRTGDWIQTNSGVKWFVTDPHPEDVRIDDIAHGLALICRYGGQCRDFYSVAQHCVLIAQQASSEAALWGLLHDATEAYLGDMVRPLKRAMPDYKALEIRTEAVICDGLRIPLPTVEVHKEVKHLDDVLLMTERRDLMNHCGIAWTPRAVPLENTIVPWSPQYAKAAFLEMFDKLNRFPLPE